VLALVLALGLAAAGDEPPPHPASTPSAPASTATPTGPHDTVRLTGIPLVSYGSDLGVQLGLAAYLYELDRTGERGDWGALGVSWTSHGPRSLELKGELLHIPRTRLRAFIQVKTSLDTAAPYWGEGAGLAGLPIAPGAGSPPAAFGYRSAAPWASIILRGPLAGRLDWWARIRSTDVSVTEPGAALRLESPPGAGGGRSTLLHTGLVFDTRDRPSSPRRGWLADASLFGSGPGPLSDQKLYGANVGARAYFEPFPGGVLAVRALYDLKLGDVPFFERALYEGITYGEGLGGAGTIRGLARDRLMGEEKALAGAELRAWLLDSHWLGRHQEWGASAGFDAGRARDRGHAPVLGAGGFLGLRALLEESVVIRFEVGFAGQGAVAYYVSFDEAF
jgi:hypothetical protein